MSPHGRRPPKKKKKIPTGRRRFSGSVVDVHGQAADLGISEKTLRAQVARGVIPFRKWGGRIIFVREEVQAYLLQLPGVSTTQALANLEQRAGR